MSDSTAQGNERNEPGVPPVFIRRILRLEGLAVAALTAVFYAHTGASWWLFAALWIVPDISMLGYLRNACWGARTYNAAHSYAAPAALAACALLLSAGNLLPYAIIWANHIAVDRLVGAGLKYPQGFAWTHLGYRNRSVISRQ